MLAEGVWGVRSTEKEVKRAVKKATVVKKPNTFCALTKVECIVVIELQRNWRSNTLHVAGFSHIVIEPRVV